jgi:hypothetical protein
VHAVPRRQDRAEPFAQSQAASQNAAPVEQSAAAAQAPERQAPVMNERKIFFCYDDAQAASGAN